jgi:hypothetical protein
LTTAPNELKLPLLRVGSTAGVVLAAVVASPAATVVAAPAADIVVVWAPGADLAPVAAAARAHGAAVIDRSPAPPAPVDTAAILERGVDAYDAVHYDEARAVLEQTLEQCDRNGAAGLTNEQLQDLFLYRGLLRAQLGEDTEAWDELVTAIIVAPARVPDPARFPPKVVDTLARARKQTLEQHVAADLDVSAPTGCTAFVDGTATAGREKLITGAHWIRIACPDRPPWGERVELTTLGASIPADPPRFAPPAEAELLVQARVAGARAIVIAEVHVPVATVRVVALDGRELERRTVTVNARRDMTPVARAIDAMLTPATDRPRWYRSRWAWATGAALLAAAVLVPVTAAIASAHPSDTLSARIPNFWPTP